MGVGTEEGSGLVAGGRGPLRAVTGDGDGGASGSQTPATVTTRCKFQP
jgi:hypothetical protein